MTTKQTKAWLVKHGYRSRIPNDGERVLKTKKGVLSLYPNGSLNWFLTTLRGKGYRCVSQEKLEDIKALMEGKCTVRSCVVEVCFENILSRYWTYALELARR